MCITICKKHGRQGFDQVCEHIDAKFKDEIYPKMHRLEFWGMILVCDDCWGNYDINKFENNPEIKGKNYFDIDSELDENSRVFKEYVEFQQALNKNLFGWCLQCIKVIKVKTARRKGEADPFPTFEKTLTVVQQEIVNKLYEKLMKNFQFQNSVYWKPQLQDRPAISVSAGAFTYPLTITIYYVVSENEQNRIIEFVKKFLSRIEFNQGKIIFFETENWTSEKNQFGLLNWYRGEEKILREVHLNY